MKYYLVAYYYNTNCIFAEPISDVKDDTIMKAFDKVNRKQMMERLKQLGIPERFRKAINSYISNRTQSTKIEGIESEPLELENGLPQGSIISLICFLIYMNPVCECIEENIPGVFVDDLCLVCSAEKPNYLSTYT